VLPSTTVVHGVFATLHDHSTTSGSVGRAEKA